MHYRQKIILAAVLIWLGFISCKKDKPDPILSSDKFISEVVFKASDNPQLSADIHATIAPDSIKILFTQGISLTSLIPTISFSGRSISPANRTAHDFTRPVTYVVTAEDGTTTTYVFSARRLSSDKSILSVVFKASDNPELSNDVSGTILQDTVKIDFPFGVSLNNLVPTISFTGKTIDPASNTSENFTAPVIYTIIAEDGTTRNYTINATQDSAGTIAGYWHLSKDSVFDDSNFVNLGGGHNIPGVYFGTTSDYYEFTSNGVLNLHENGVIASTNYQILPNNRLSVTGWDSYYGTGAIDSLTAKIAIFSWETVTNYGARFFRRVSLKK